MTDQQLSRDLMDELSRRFLGEPNVTLREITARVAAGNHMSGEVDGCSVIEAAEIDAPERDEPWCASCWKYAEEFMAPDSEWEVAKIARRGLGDNRVVVPRPADLDRLRAVETAARNLLAHIKGGMESRTHLPGDLCVRQLAAALDEAAA